MNKEPGKNRKGMMVQLDVDWIAEYESCITSLHREIVDMTFFNPIAPKQQFNKIFGFDYRDPHRIYPIKRLVTFSDNAIVSTT